MSKARVTIREVARHAGVSVSTASNALNNKSEVAAETRQRVLSAAHALHFTPNALIRSLQRGTTNTIGVRTWPLTADPAPGMAQQFLKGVCDQIARAGHDVLLYSNFPGRSSHAPAEMFLDGRVDGVIVVPQGIMPEELDRLAASHLPAVIVYDDSLAGRAATVTIDNAAGISAAIDYLVRLGHQRIAFSAPLTTFDYRERAEAYRAGLARHGLPHDPALLVIQEKYHADILRLCAALLSLPEPPTALIAGDDLLARRWLAALSAQGLSVPEQFSVIGFDDSPLAQAAPALTTIRQSAEEVGRTAAIFLERLMTGAAPGECSARLPVELIVRETTAKRESKPLPARSSPPSPKRGRAGDLTP